MTRERTTGRRSRAISSLTTVDTAVNRQRALRNLFRLIGSGIDSPLERKMNEIPNNTALSVRPLNSVMVLTNGKSHKVRYRPTGVVWDMKARQGEQQEPPFDSGSKSEGYRAAEVM
jgi:hypothetical protein